MSENATPYLAVASSRSPALPLGRVLTQEYHSRYGCWPSGTGWQAEPWCRDYVRVMEGALVIPHADALDAVAVVLAIGQEVPHE